MEGLPSTCHTPKGKSQPPLMSFRSAPRATWLLLGAQGTRSAGGSWPRWVPRSTGCPSLRPSGIWLHVESRGHGAPRAEPQPEVVSSLWLCRAIQLSLTGLCGHRDLRAGPALCPPFCEAGLLLHGNLHKRLVFIKPCAKASCRKDSPPETCQGARA